MKLKQIAPNFCCVESKMFDLYFSYETLIAFRQKFTSQLFVCENIWGSTTGKHINIISEDKKLRLKQEDFIKKCEEFGIV